MAIASLAKSASGPALLPLGHHQGKPPIRLTRPVYVIGSRSSARIHLLSNTVSKAHALLVRSNGRTYIRDLSSRTKVYVNGDEIREAVLEHDDLIKIGTFTFQYLGGPGEGKFSIDGRKPMPAKLEISGTDYPVPIEQKVLLIGRRSSCDINLLEESVSTAHAVIFETDGQRFIRDLGSRTGTFVNGVSTHQHQLSPTDAIRIGESTLRYLPNEIAAATVVEEEPAEELTAADVEEAAEPILPEAPIAVEPEIAAVEPEPESVESDAPIPMEVDEPAAIPVEAAEPEIPVEPEIPAEPAIAETEAIPMAAEEEPAPAIEVEPEIVEPEPVEPAIAETEAIPMAAEEEPAPAIEVESEPVEEPAAIPMDEEEAPVAAPVEIEEEIAPPPAVEVEAAAELDVPLEPEEAVEAAVEPVESIEPSAQEVSATLDLSSQPSEPVISAAPEPEQLELPVQEEAPAAPIEPPALDLVEVAESESEISEPQPKLELPAVKVEPVRLPPAPKLVLRDPVEPEPAAPVQETVEDEVPLDTPPVDIETISPEPLDEPDVPIVLDTLPEQSAGEVEDVEVLDKTEPTPQSALESAADELALAALSGDDEAPGSVADSMTDTTFARAVREFTGDEIGEIVEPAPAVDAPKAEEPAVEPVEAIESIEPVEPPAQEVSATLDLSSQPTEPAEELPELELPAEPEPVQEAPVPEPVAPAPPPRARVPWGSANQENFLGGVPISLRQPSKGPRDTPAQEETVKDLIEKIDTVAASAEAAATAPPPPIPSENDVPPMPLPLPVPPPRPVRGAPVRPTRIPPKRNRDLLIETETAAPKERSVIDTGFDGLAFSPMRDMDVFSQHSPELEEASGNGDGEHEEEAPLPEPAAKPSEPAARRPRGGISAKFDPPQATPIATELAGEPQTDPAVAAHRTRVTPSLPGPVEGEIVPPPRVMADLTESDAVALRRRYKRRVTSLLVLMVLLMGGSAWTIYNYMAAAVGVEASLKYKNLGALSHLDQVYQQKKLVDIMAADETRRVALDKIHEKPEISEGFLGDRNQYMTIVSKAKFTQDQPDSSMQLLVSGRDSKANVARMSALLAAIYKFNSQMILDASNARKQLELTNQTVIDQQQNMDRLQREIESLQMLADARPTQQQIDALKADLDKYEQAWNEAMKAVKTAETELNQLKTAPAGNANPAAPRVAAVDDEKLKSLQASLDELNVKVAAANAASNAQSVAAKRSLDSALDAFQKQIVDAQGTLNGNPELAAYVSAAQQLHENTRQLTDDLIHKQEAHFTRLTELKQKLNDRLEKQRATAWEKDKELQDLMDRQALVTRQYNAALGGGLQKQAEDKKAELDLVNNMIKARQNLLPGDAFYAEAVQQLQLIIDSTKKDIESDRQRAEQWLTQLQQAFASGQSIEKLPQEQKQLATQIQQRLEQINGARKDYNQALDAGAADADAQLKGQVVTLQAAIDARRAQLATQNLSALQDQQEQTRLAAIQTKQQELTRLKDVESDASKAFFAKSRDLRSAMARKDESNDNAAKLDEQRRSKDQAKKEHDAAVAQLESRKCAAAMAVEPVKPDESSIIKHDGDDRRLMYIGISSCSIALLMSLLIFLTVHSVPVPSIQATDLRPVPTEPAAKDGGDDEEDHEPAII